MAENTSNTPFDDAYRTLSAKGTRLMIPLINYMFRRHYPMNTPITLLDNETEEDNSNIITNSKFMLGNGDLYNIFIVGEQTKLNKDVPYILYDYMLRYTLSHLSEMYKTGTIILPTVGVLNLYGNYNDIKTMKLLHTNAGINVTVSDLNLEEFPQLKDLVGFELYCLMPYHILLMEDRLKKVDNVIAKQLSIEKFNECITLLKKANENGDISDNEELLIIHILHQILTQR